MEAGARKSLARPWRIRLFWAVLLAASLPVVAQRDEGAPFFSVSSDRTFAPEEEPGFHLWSLGLRRLEFRVYRIVNSAEFFAGLEDLHRFGTGRFQRPRALTPLERFHRWKTAFRLRLRNTVRKQFSPESRTAIRLRWGGRSVSRTGPAERLPSPGKQAEQFAGLPLLNPQMLVARWVQTVSAQRRWEPAFITFAAPGKGLYLVEATDGAMAAYTLVNVTRLAILAKASPGRIVARVVDRTTGKGLRGLPVALVAPGKKPRELVSGEDGFVQTELREPPDELTLVARQGQDVAAASVLGYYLRNELERTIKGYVYTDRPVYRPGHKVRFKGILRQEAAGSYALPPFRDVEVRVSDSEGADLLRRRMQLNEFGTVSGELTLPGAAPLGYYSISLSAGQVAADGGFFVEEYRKPDYEVRVQVQPQRSEQGRMLEATVEAHYYYGEPVRQGKVEWAIYRTRYWPPWWDEEGESGADEENIAEYGGGEQTLLREGKLDASGKSVLRFLASNAPWDARYRVEARVTDVSGRAISGSGSVVATVGPFFLLVTPETYICAPNSNAAVTVEARDYENQPAAGVRVTLVMRRWDWRSQTGPLVSRAQGITGADGKVTLHLPSGEGGSMRLEASALTPSGRTVMGEGYLWVTGQGGWERAAAQEIQIIPDKRSYQPGETAKILLVSGVLGADLWVTAEGRGIYDTGVIRASGPTATMEVRIRPEHSPNFFLNAICVHGNRFYQGTRRIRVPAAGQELQVSLRAGRERYQPGEKAEFLIEARDRQGRPVRAEFSLGVVDEAIYAIRKDPAPDLTRYFYGSIYNRVDTANSFAYFFQGEAGTRRMRLAEVRPSRARAQLKPLRLVDPAIRKAFPDTAFWAADLRTDSAGRARAEFTFPDSLTLWRATARGVTMDTKTGSAIARTVVRKNLILSLPAPRFLRQGDEIELPIVVRNYLPSSKDVQVSLETVGAAMEGPARARLSVGPQAESEFRVRAKALARDPMKLVGKALTVEESDAVEFVVPVHPVGALVMSSRAGALGPEREIEQTELSFPETAAEARFLEIRLASSLAGSLLGSLDYLISFPYGCTEQTMSSFLPNVIVREAAGRLGLRPEWNDEDLRKKTRAGLDRLYEFQHEDGGWGWWKGDPSTPFLTAYVVSGLKMAERAGIGVRRPVVRRGEQWLRQRLNRSEAGDSPDLRAYMLYSLAMGRATEETQRLITLYEGRRALGPLGLALLGLALTESSLPDKPGMLETLAGELERRARRAEGVAWWESPSDELLGIGQDASVETTAWVLRFLSAARPLSPAASPAVFYLLRARGRGPFWASTKQTAMVVYGLTEWIRSHTELQPDFEASAWVGGKQVGSWRFTPDSSRELREHVIRIPSAELPPGLVNLRFSFRGKGRLYWSAAAGYYLTQAAEQTEPGRRLRIRREYYRLVGRQSGGYVRYHMESLSGTVRVGDLLASRVVVSGDAWNYVLVEDPIPAGAEQVREPELFELAQRPPWWAFAGNRQFRDDRTAYFVWSQRGEREFLQVLRLTAAGLFHVSPARVEPMYQPGSSANTVTARIEVIP